MSRSSSSDTAKTVFLSQLTQIQVTPLSLYPSTIYIHFTPPLLVSPRMFWQIQWNIWKLSKSNININSFNSGFRSFGMWQGVSELAVTNAFKKYSAFICRGWRDHAPLKMKALFTFEPQEYTDPETNHPRTTESLAKLLEKPQTSQQV